MWLWRQRAWHRKTVFLSKLTLVALAVHVVLLFFLFFVRNGPLFTRHIDFNVPSAPILFLPFEKTTYGLYSASVPGRPLASRQQITTVTRSGTDASFSRKKNHELQAQKKPAKRGVTVAANKQQKQIEKKSSTAVQKKELSKKALTQDLAKKQERQKKELAVDLPVLATAKKTVPPVVDEKDSQPIQPQMSPVFVGQYDLDALELCQAVRDAVEHVWRPPAGMNPDASCKVRVLVGWDGHVEAVTVEQSSRVAAFDASVRHALLQLELPKNAYGKELVIPFGGGEFA